MDRIYKVLFGCVVFLLILAGFFYWNDQPKVIKTTVTLSEPFTPCQPAEDLNKSDKTKAEHITWTKDYCLVWNDFKGQPDYNKNNTAWTETWLQTYSEITVDQSPLLFQFSEIEVVAFFDTTKSWVKLENLTSQNMTELRHEQGHFDLAEEEAREIEARMNSELMGQFFPYELATGDHQKDARAIANQLASEIFFEEFNLPQLDDEYDALIKNGTRSQVFYNDRFDKLRK